MKERVFKNWRTTICGVILIGIIAGAVYLGKATLTEGFALLPFAFTLIFVKDPAKYADK